MSTGNQATLLGLWSAKGGKGGEERAESAGCKRRRGQSPPPPRGAAPPLRLGHCSTPRWHNVSLPDGPMLLLRGCVGGQKASERKATRKELASLPHWEENLAFTMFGKECRMRRSICQFSSGGKLKYSYSGVVRDAPEFPPVLGDIKRQVEDLICNHILRIVDEGKKPKNMVHAAKEGKAGNDLFNYCLLNWYRSGEEYMSYHSDDEDALNPDAPIASVSLGVTRSFDIRPKNKDACGKRSRVSRIALGDGDLLLMLPPMQNHYEHAIPVEKKATGERINLTFRRVATKK
ncbi:hypothetical protein ACHAXT_006735 [Thalassiosira profunda]